MYHIKVLNSVSKTGLSRLPADQFLCGDFEAPEAVLLRSADLHGQAIAPSLLAVGRAGAGTNNIPVSDMTAAGVVVFNAPGANANAVKELVLAAMLICVRNLDLALGFVRGLDASRSDLDEFVEASKKKFVGTELAGRTLGVVGLGAIGVLVANAARSLGMRVLGFDPHMTVDGAWRLSSDVVKAASLAELYAQSDFVTFHVPLNTATKGIFSEASLSVVKKSCVLINFARDGIIEENAIRRGLQENVLGRYVSDFPHAEFLTNPKCLALPHLGASTLEAEENCAIMVADQVRDYLQDGHISNAVNFPSMRLPRAGKQRVCIINRNVPNMIGQLSHAFGVAGLNIAQMQNASRGDVAYNIVDVDSVVPDGVAGELRKIEGILRVRVIA
jgi:D-3-phosphoglycerate dehydrogenase / 2-oxoglutarate reductase